MHLLAAKPGAVETEAAVDLAQSPADILVLSAADSEILSLARACAKLRQEHPQFPGVRLANLLRLGHNMSVDIYVERLVAHARLVIVRLLGGRGYWSYGVDQLVETC